VSRVTLTVVYHDRHVVQYTCDYWMRYRTAAAADDDDAVVMAMERLQTECDMVLLRAVNSILSAQRSVVSDLCRPSVCHFYSEL